MHEIEYNWDLGVSDAHDDQKRMRANLLVEQIDLRLLRSIVAIGVAYSERTKAAFAVATPMHLNGSLLNESLQYTCSAHSEFPYIPGLYAYREGPAICKLINSLPGLPDLIVFDAQGTAHPKRFGLAAHIGVIYDVPTLGLTRKLLIGRHGQVSETDGAHAPVRDRSGSEVGLAYRFLEKCELAFASPGHRTNMRAVQDYCKGITSIRSCFPASLAIVHEAANRLAKSSKL